MTNSQGFNGLKFIKIYALNEINSKVTRVIILLAVIFFMVIFTAIVISLVFSYKLRNPIAKIAEAIIGQNGSLPSNFTVNTSISEVKLIASRLKVIVDENKRIGKDLSNKNSLLKYYYLNNKVKDIGSMKALEDFDPDYGNFTVVLFKVIFKPNFFREFDQSRKTALNLLKNLLDIIIAEDHPGSITFQIENDQYISIVNLNNKKPDDIVNTLNYINELTLNDREYFFIIITCSDIYKDASQLSSAYNEAFRLLKYRRLSDETQILQKADISTNSSNFCFTLDQEKTDCRRNVQRGQAFPFCFV